MPQTKSLPLAPIISTFLILYLYWVAFEWILVSRIPSFAAIQAIRNTVDVLPLVMLVLSVIVLNIKFSQLELKILSAFGLIVVISMFSLGIEGGPLASISEYIGVTVRFVPLVILIRFATDDIHDKLIPHIRNIYWILVALAVINLVDKEAFIQIFLPPAEIFGEVLPTTYKDPGISASFINTVEFAFFFLGLTVLYLNGSTKSSVKSLISVVSVLLIILSFSIASILALLIIFFLRSERKLLVGGIMVSGLVLSFILLNSYIEELLGMDIAYWIEISSEFNRLGYFTKVFPEFMTGHFKDLFLGMGYDADVVDMKLANYSNTPYVMINNENNLKYLKDVYWLSILFAQGIIALALTLTVLKTLWNNSIRFLPSEKYSSAKTLILLVLFLGFFNQVLDIKAFTYIFWLTAALSIRSLSGVEGPSSELELSSC